MKLEVYVMAWWQTQQNIQSLVPPQNMKLEVYVWPHTNMKLEVYVMAWWQTQQNIQSLSTPRNMKLEVYVMAWWQTQQNIQSLSIPTKYEVGSLCDGLVTDTTKHPIIKYPHEIWSWKSMWWLGDRHNKTSTH